VPRFNHELLLTVRLDLGMTQEESAKLLGIDARTYRRYESGSVNDGGFEVRGAARRRLIRKMCEELGIEDEATLVLDDAPARVAREATTMRLPRARHFAGRREELRAIADALASTRILVIVGIGGAGKTALVEHFVAMRKSSRAPFVHTLYEQPRVETFLDDAARAIADGNLVVLDGFEVAQSDGRDGLALGEIIDASMRRFLRKIAGASGDGRVLLTTRLALSDLEPWEGSSVLTLTLAPLDAKDANAILRAWGVKDAATRDALGARAGGHALSLAMLGSWASALGHVDASATALAEAATEGARDTDPRARKLARVLHGYAAALGDKERALLSRVALFPSGAEPSLLTMLMAERASATEVLVMLARMRRLGLVTGARPQLHPFLRAHFASLLDVPAAELHARARDALASSLDGKAEGPFAEVALLDRYETLFVHTLASGDVARAYELYVRSLGGFENLGLRLGEMSRGLRVVRAFTGANDAIDARLAADLRANLAYEWGLYASALGDLKTARTRHEEHLALLEEERSEKTARSYRMMGLRTLAYTVWLGAELERAAEIVAESIAIARTEDSAFHLVRGLALAAMIAHDRGHDGDADAFLVEARGVERSPTLRRALWEAEIRLSRGDHDKATALAVRAKKDAEELGWPVHVAHAEIIRGHAALTRGDSAAARDCLQYAHNRADASGDVEMELRCLELQAALDRSSGRTEEAAAVRTRVGDLARETGFLRFLPGREL
jgi:transcriptional regulator with XRE-family HTH domain